MLEDLDNGKYLQTVIDFDNAERNWYIVDPGTVTWVANMELWFDETWDREERLGLYETWFLDEYGFDTAHWELQEGCQFRSGFMAYLC